MSKSYIVSKPKNIRNNQRIVINTMGKHIRHFNALSRKNWINWKRTLMGSVCEILMPVILMLVLVGLRQKIPMETIDNIDLAKMRHGLYPMAKKDNKGDWGMSFDNIADQSIALSEFMINGNISTDGKGYQYIPMLDGRGPLMFFPPHCVALPTVNIFASPIIAYVKSDSIIQEELVKQFRAFYENQEGMWQLIKENSMLYDYIAEARNAKLQKTPEQIQMEAEAKADMSNNNILEGVQRSADQTFFPNIDFHLKEYESKEALDAAIADPQHGRHPEKEGICFGFTVHEHSPTDIELELFFNDLFVLEWKSLPSQANRAISSYQMQPQIRDYAFYSYYGFAYLQNWAANTVLRHVTKNPNAQITAMTVPMKIPPMIKDPFSFMLGMIAPYVFMLMYMPMLYRTTFRIVQEKENRARETMRMMGMQDSPYWASWLVYHTCINFMISLAVMVLAGFGIFSFSSVTVIWLVFFLYGQAIFGLIVTIQALFQQARTAAVMCTLLYLGASAFQAGGEKSSTLSNAILSLLPTTCMTALVKVILGLEQNGLNVEWGNLDRDYKHYSVKLGLTMMFASFVFWTAIGLYFENVLPRQFGKRLHPCFCFGGSSTTKCCTYTDEDSDSEDMSESDSSKQKIVQQPNKVVAVEMSDMDLSIHADRKDQPQRNLSASYNSITDINKNFETAFMKPDAWEGVGPEVAKLEFQQNFMKIQNLRKTYGNGFTAVKGINLKLYPDQIFVLLGHNGAGKTSTISLLTGLYEPTQGSCEIFGVDMFQNVEKVREFLGICPQHDVLFELLTPLEHMEIFYDFKCQDPDPERKRKEISKLLIDVGVDDKMHDLAGQLSGGNQRKLSVAISLCGGSRFVVLDEPTAGMDLSARRQTWSMLKEYKRDRIILLTTHYMDEADILGDRIGIMASGQLVCLGSSMFLKRKYGVGYNLTMLKASKEQNDLVLPYFWANLGPDVKKMSEIQSEITLQIPKEYAEMFRIFFKNFDKDLDRLKIVAYGVSITTLEDVFMKVGHIDVEDESVSNSRRSDMELDQQPLEYPNNLLDESSLDGSRSQQVQRSSSVIMKPNKAYKETKEYEDTFSAADNINQNTDEQSPETPYDPVGYKPEEYKISNPDKVNFDNDYLEGGEEENRKKQTSSQQQRPRMSTNAPQSQQRQQKQGLRTDVEENYQTNKGRRTLKPEVLPPSQEGTRNNMETKTRKNTPINGNLMSVQSASVQSALVQPQMTKNTNSKLETHSTGNKNRQLKESNKNPSFLRPPKTHHRTSSQKSSTHLRDQSQTEINLIDLKDHKPKIGTHLKGDIAEKAALFTLANSKTTDGFQNSLNAVLKKRGMLYWNSKRYVFFDVLLPAILMAAGIFVTTIAFFERSESRIMGPDRMEYNNQLIIFDQSVTLGGNKWMVWELSQLMANHTDHFDFHFTDDSMSFDRFEEFVYDYGRKHAPEMPYFYSAYQIYEADIIDHQYKFYNFLNMTNQDAGGLYPQFMYEAIIRRATGNKDFKFKVRSTPYPAISAVVDRKHGADAATVAFMTAVAYAMLLTTISGQIVEERITRLKHIQVISGVQLGAYWLANMVVDIIKIEITSLTVAFMFWYAETKYLPARLAYILFPFAAVPMTYVQAFLFPSVASSQTFTMFMNFLMILVGPGLVFFLRFLKPVFGLAEFLNVLMKFVPGYALATGLFFNGPYHSLMEFRTAPEFKGYEIYANHWSWKNTLGDVVGLILNAVLWTAMLYAIETGLYEKVKAWRLNCSRKKMPKPKKAADLDDDVHEEAERIKGIKDKDLQIKVSNLRKVYLRGSGPCNPGTPLCAVENLSFGLSKGETFALLGVNGAGKSTTFKILTAEEQPTSGSIKIQGMDMNKHFQKVRKLIGYCPQYNPIFDTLTVEQNLHYFAQIKGIPPKFRGILCDDAINQLGLDIHKTKHAGELSGGNKRKLSVAIAIVGNPPIILLDEPSAGMDPEARRFMWEVVGNIASKKTSAVILTSHLMEEAEALSTKMGIMVKGGQFKCFGSSQHIKNKFGVGFEVEVKIRVPKVGELREMADRELDGCLIEKPNRTDKDIFVGSTLQYLMDNSGLTCLEADQVRKELLIHFRQSKEAHNIECLADPFYDYDRIDRKRDVRCTAYIFMEKLCISRSLFGTIQYICVSFGSIELLEQYGNYMRIRVSSQNKTIGQMFGLVDEMKKEFNIDQYSISQTTLEQIFQSFANLNFDAQVKTYQLAQDGKTLIVT